jgi:uncharacterized protein with von Willebrand factor type A (vWA) domain
VAITSSRSTTTSAAQTIKVTVDVADAGSTVKILDGSTQIGSAVVASNGAWSANVALANQGANVLIATDANGAGTGKSSAVSFFNLNSIAPTMAAVMSPQANDSHREAASILMSQETVRAASLTAPSHDATLLSASHLAASPV